MSSSIRTTSSLPFFYCNSSSTLFSVTPGVPARDALKTASGFLDVALDSIRKLGDSCGDNSAWATEHLITLAKAIIDSATKDEPELSDEFSLSNVFERLHALRENGVVIINPMAVKYEIDDAKGFFDLVSQQVKGGAA